MNGQDNIDRELGRALHRQADGIGGAPISIEAVKGTARGIRRRRALAATAAVAAAVAIIVPTAIAGTDLLRDSGGKELPPASQSPTAADDPTGDVTARDDLDVRNLETGDAPDLVWIGQGVLHDRDREIPLKGAYDAVAPLGDRYVVTANDEGDQKLVVLDENGAELATYPLSGGLASNAGHTIVAWMGTDNTPRVLQEGLDEPLQMAAFDGTFSYSQVVGLVGNDCTTDPETTVGGGCTVEFTADDDQGVRSSYASSSHGFADRSAPEGHAVTAVSPTGGAIEITEVRDDGTCSVARAGSGDEMWTTCDYRGIAYSPDGSKLLAHDDYGDGFGDTQVTVLDANAGDPLVDLKSTEDSQAFVFDQVWEDEEHLLAVVYQQGEWSVVRFGLDGSREYAVEPVSAPDDQRPFFLER